MRGYDNNLLELLEKDPRCGEKFKTLTILGYVLGVHKEKKYVLRCSVCNEDKELYPKLFFSSYSNLKRGAVPCGCGGRRSFDKDQWEVVIRRECTKDNYNFEGFVGEYKGSETRLKLKDNVVGNSWETTITRYVLAGNKNKLDTKKYGKRFGEEEYVYRLFNNPLCKLEKGKHSISFTDSTRKVLVSCSKCYHDEYAKAGLLGKKEVKRGVFFVEKDPLNRGSVPCRCSDRYQYTKEQTLLRVDKVCKKIGYTVQRVISNRKVEVMCDNGHVTDKHIHSLLNGSKCKCCNNGVKGWFGSRSEEIDHLYLAGFYDKGVLSFYKVGRTFSIKGRKSSLKCDSGLEVRFLRIYENTHKTVFTVEQGFHKLLESHKQFPEYKSSKEDGSWKGMSECFTKDSLYVAELFFDCL